MALGNGEKRCIPLVGGGARARPRDPPCAAGTLRRGRRADARPGGRDGRQDHGGRRPSNLPRTSTGRPARELWQGSSGQSSGKGYDVTERRLATGFSSGVQRDSRLNNLGDESSKSANLQALHATIQPTRPGYRNTIWSSICDDSRHLHLKIVAFGAQIALRGARSKKVT